MAIKTIKTGLKVAKVGFKAAKVVKGAIDSRNKKSKIVEALNDMVDRNVTISLDKAVIREFLEANQDEILKIIK